LIDNTFYKRILNFLHQQNNSKILFYLIYFVITFNLFNFYLSGWNKSISGGSWDGGITGVPHKYWYVIFVTALWLPILFFLTKDIKWDRFIGNLSYPVYLGHELVLYYLSTSKIETQNHGALAFAITTLLSILVVILLENPIDKYRHKKFLRNSLTT